MWRYIPSQTYFSKPDVFVFLYMFWVIWDEFDFNVHKLTCDVFRKNLHLSEERIMYLKELSKKEAIYERLASALGMTSDDCNGRLEDL